MPSSFANESQFRYQSSRNRASCTSRSPSEPESPAPVTPNCDVVDQALAELQLQSQDIRKQQDLVDTTATSSSSRKRSGWEIKGSKLSLNTHNRIRNIVESLKIKPNPEKPMIPLSIGEHHKYIN